MNKAKELLERAREIAKGDLNWAELSNALFDQETGIIAGVFSTQAERAAFIKTPEYQEIRKLLDAAIKRTGIVEGATPRKSGKFVVRLPASLHAALEREAAEEGVSLNQLVVAKLAVTLKEASEIAVSQRKSA